MQSFEFNVARAEDLSTRADYIKITDSSGHFALKLDLQPRDEKPTTYSITASFVGEEGQIKTAYATAPDGTQYPVCTTIQYDYLPASTTAFLTVEPPTTTVSADPETTATEQTESSTVEVPTTKTPEEMQEEAEDEGWLKIKHKLSWWYPRYRMPFVLDVVKCRRKMRLRRLLRREK